jgi:DNA-binding NtrC family response regulator
VKQRILVVDDEAPIREGLAEVLREAGYEVFLAASAEEAWTTLESEAIHAVITDVRMPGSDGLELLKRVKTVSPGTEVLVITGHGTFEQAVTAVKAGAHDFITKPFDLEVVKISLSRALEHRRLVSANRELSRQLDRVLGNDMLVGESPAFKKVLEVVARVATTKVTVLLSGETGTGKELIGRAIHQTSPRQNAPFISVNCGALPENLIESELFGYAKGAFTGADRTSPGLFEAADGGTFFLDEIGNIGAPIQGKLLRVLQEGEVLRLGERAPRPVDVRIVAATNRDLKQAVERGEFREDLFYRLNVVSIELPSLRERPQDVPLIAQHFLKTFCAATGRSLTGFSPDALSALLAYPWPGNVRELRNCIERAVILSLGSRIERSDLPTEVLGPSSTPSPLRSLEAVEKDHILQVLRLMGGHQGKASEVLGVNRRTLYRKLLEWGVDHRELG